MVVVGAFGLEAFRVAMGFFVLMEGLRMIFLSYPISGPICPRKSWHITDSHSLDPSALRSPLLSDLSRCPLFGPADCWGEN